MSPSPLDSAPRIYVNGHPVLLNLHSRLNVRATWGERMCLMQRMNEEFSGM